MPGEPRLAGSGRAARTTLLRTRLRSSRNARRCGLNFEPWPNCSTTRVARASDNQGSGGSAVSSDYDSDVDASNKDDDEYFVFLSTTVSQGLHPDTQAEVTIMNNPDFRENGNPSG